MYTKTQNNPQRIHDTWYLVTVFANFFLVGLFDRAYYGHAFKQERFLPDAVEQLDLPADKPITARVDVLDVRVSRVDNAEYSGHDLLLPVGVDLEVVDHSHSLTVLLGFHFCWVLGFCFGWVSALFFFFGGGGVSDIRDKINPTKNTKYHVGVIFTFRLLFLRKDISTHDSARSSQNGIIAILLYENTYTWQQALYYCI